ERLLTDGIYLSRHGQYQSRSHKVRFSSADFLLHVVAADNGDRYVDGEIVRQGPVGDQGDGAYSAGRGGAGNIGSPHLLPTTLGKAHDLEVVPDTAIRKSADGDYHTGVSSNPATNFPIHQSIQRGGLGNVHLDEATKEKEEEEKTEKRKSSPHEGLADKLKNKFFGKK
ncbi:hypothetical protein V8E54_007880, partial [Elaphomyces granulatus]